MRLNDYKRTNTRDPWKRKYRYDTSTTVSGIADTADEAEARSKHLYYISVDLKCMPHTVPSGSHGPPNPPKGQNMLWALTAEGKQRETQVPGHVLPVIGKALR